MKVSDLIVEVRDADLNRVGQILATDLVGFTGVLRFRKVGTWEIPLRYDNPLADALRAPGAGIIVTGPTGVLFSGPTQSATRSQSQDDPIGTWTIRGVTDEVVLGERLAYATPSTADVTAQVDEQDVRTGAASTVMYGYVDANIGPSAPTARKIAALALATDTAVGSTVTGRARFENLGNLLTRLAQIDGLGFGIKQDGADLVFSVYEPTDRSATIRMDIDNNVLTKSEYTYTAPTATRAIVAGGGAGTTRAFAEVTTDDSETAETAWGRRIEVFKDQRQTTDSGELTQAGTEELADKGKTLEAISVSPSDDSTMAYGIDWALGDKVSVVAGTTTITQVVTEVGISIQEDGVRIGATVGEPSVADENSDVADVQQNQEARITNLEVNATEGGGGSSSTAWADITGKPSTFAPSTHASSHASGGADAITVAESQVTGLTSALAAKAPIASPTLTGTATTPAIRVTNSDDASATSTSHGFQVGDSSGPNVRIDSNEIIAVNNGVIASLNLQADGGTVNIGGTTAATVNLNASRILATHYPYAMSAGDVDIIPVANTPTAATVTFPAGRFTQAPIVTTQANTSVPGSVVTGTGATAISSTGFTMYLRRTNTSNTTVMWQAIQMTSSNASG